MTGTESLEGTLIAGGVDVSFTDPGIIKGLPPGEPDRRAQDMLRIDPPTINFVALEGHGVPRCAVANVDDFVRALAEAIAEPAADRSAEVKVAVRI